MQSCAEVRWPADSRPHAWALPGMVAHTHGRQHVADSRPYAYYFAPTEQTPQI